MNKLQKVATGLMCSGVVILAQAGHNPIATEYYPLTEGNAWTYRVSSGTQKAAGSVTWRITRARKTQRGYIYQVWPTPMQADDEAMELSLSSEGVVEASTMTPIIKLPIRAGDQWADRGVAATRKFRVLSVGQPCSTRLHTWNDCLVIEDEDDAAAGLRTVTQYARYVGPVKYEYFRQGGSQSNRPVQTLEIISYHVAQGTGFVNWKP